MAACGARSTARARPPCRVLEPIPKDTPGAQTRYKAFLDALDQLGWTDGRNIQIAARWGGGNNVETRKQAADLAALAPDVIVAGGGVVAEVTLKVTRTIPVVFVIVPDPSVPDSSNVCRSRAATRPAS